MLIKPFLKITLRPGSIQPFSRVVDSCIGFLGNGIIARTNLLEKSVTLVRLGNGNVMVVSESLERTVGPAIF